MLLNCGVGGDSWESLGSASRSNQSILREGDQSWVFIGRNDVEVETPILWPPDVKSWLIGKDPDAGKDWGQEEMGTPEDEMVGWHHRLNGHEFGWALGWWWTGRPGMLWFMGSQRVGHGWVTELNWWQFLHTFFKKENAQMSTDRHKPSKLNSSDYYINTFSLIGKSVHNIFWVSKAQCKALSNRILFMAHTYTQRTGSRKMFYKTLLRVFTVKWSVVFDRIFALLQTFLWCSNFYTISR